MTTKLASAPKFLLHSREQTVDRHSDDKEPLKRESEKGRIKFELECITSARNFLQYSR